ncbi:hypothetical protein ACFO0N_19215 [Halobium salinum]|uniref:Uncharacterized protein n=1 Tax=Halobium salinum TaxID=1364940 RepID=A0ABD5PGU2_9EURY|nr:hypothetical protein [Halobium salinum]
MSDGEGSDSDVGTKNTMRGRVDASRAKMWVLLGANRLLLAAGFALFVYGAFLLVSVFIAPNLQAEIRSADTIETLFSTMLSVIVTGTTLVITINQLVISQENGPLGDQRKRMSDAMDFRTYSSELFDEAPPSDPNEFLYRLVDVSHERALALRRLVAGDAGNDDDLREQVDEFVDSLEGNAEEVKEELQDAKFGDFKVLTAALNFNYSWKIYQVERLTQTFGDELGEDEQHAFHQLQTALTMFGPVREHIKTLYFQWALVDLSRYILYAAIPALAVAGSMQAIVGAETFGGVTLGVPDATWVVGAAFTFSLVPFLVFASYVLRIATVAQRTLAIGPLILRESDG